MSNKGFTILEVLIVIGIMGLIAAMVWPMRGILDDSQRERVTIEKMDAIVEAMLGHEQLKDPYDMSRTIGGFVGDMGKWPNLYEPGGTGLGGVRGEFIGGRFQWLPSFGKVPDMRKESLGQPRGLWTRYLTNQSSPDITGDDWKGPYLTPPVTRNPALGKHYAKNQAEYGNLNDTDRAYFHLLQGSEQLTDGWNRAFRFFITVNGESFCIVSLGPRGVGYPAVYEQNCDPDSPENQGKIVRALHKSDWQAVQAQSARHSSSMLRLIFITQDHMERIVRALIGDSPSGPNTGYTGDLLDWPELFNWVCRFDRDGTQSAPYPCSGICRGAGGVDGLCQDAACFNGEPGGSGRDASENVISCAAYPTGQWENKWLEPGNPVALPFNYGQPRGLWDRGNLESSKFGVGWRHAYLPNPSSSGPLEPDVTDPNEFVEDYFNQPFHFFKIGTAPSQDILILSGGDDERVIFPTTTPGQVFEYPVPITDIVNRPGTVADKIAALINETQEFLELRTYNFNFNDYDFSGVNEDNILRLVRRNEWLPGFMDVNVVLADLQTKEACDVTNAKCRLYGILPDQSDLLSGPVWDAGTGLCGFKAKYDDLTVKRVVSGGRYLVCWKGVTDEPGSGDPGWWRIISIYAHPARIEDRTYYPVTSGFQPLP